MTDQQSLLHTNESRLTTFLIGILIIVGGFMIYSFFKGGDQKLSVDSGSMEDAGSSIESSDEKTETVLSEPEVVQGDDDNEEGQEIIYVVKSGDSLWKIAEEKLGDGFAWKELAGVNNISLGNPVIGVGQELIVSGFGGPESEEGDVLSALTAEVNDSGETISTETYTVEKGDTLWRIAEKIYSDGTRWREIYEASENNLSMYVSSTGQTYPMIHVGNILVIP